MVLKVVAIGNVKDVCHHFPGQLAGVRPFDQHGLFHGRGFAEGYASNGDYTSKLSRVNRKALLFVFHLLYRRVNYISILLHFFGETIKGIRRSVADELLKEVINAHWQDYAAHLVLLLCFTQRHTFHQSLQLFIAWNRL